MAKFSTFNAFGCETIDAAQSHIPVWLGVVGPVPVGGTIKKEFVRKGLLIPAGSPVNLTDKIITPFVGWEVVAFSAAGGSETYDTIVVKAADFGGVEIAPAADDVIQKVGATFAATGAARAVYSSTLITEGTNAGCYTVLIAHANNLGSLSAGDVLTPSAGTAGASGKSIAVQPNGYLYNDIYFGDLGGSANEYTLAASGAVVKYHHDGLLVELTPSAAVKEQMAAAVPGVLQVLV